jgi:alpha-tubulin suppressor-like RCC1 family protein
MLTKKFYLLLLLAGAACCGSASAAGGVAVWGEINRSDVPVALDQSGVLSGKTVTALSAGNLFYVALCSDGTLAAWGRNAEGELGNGTTTDSSVPVQVDQSGVLRGKTVTGVSAAGYFCLALCSDGTVAAWGFNGDGELGDGATVDSKVPVLVDRTGVLSGKTVTAVSTRNGSSLALCSDGTLAAWGYNGQGELGNGTTTTNRVPVLVDRTGVLSGKTVTAVSAGWQFSLALCSDGTIAAWGGNQEGELGNGATADSSVPVLVDQSGVLSCKTVNAISDGD